MRKTLGLGTMQLTTPKDIRVKFAEAIGFPNTYSGYCYVFTDTSYLSRFNIYNLAQEPQEIVNGQLSPNYASDFQNSFLQQTPVYPSHMFVEPVRVGAGVNDPPFIRLMYGSENRSEMQSSQKLKLHITPLHEYNISNSQMIDEADKEFDRTINSFEYHQISKMAIMQYYVGFTPIQDIMDGKNTELDIEYKVGHIPLPLDLKVAINNFFIAIDDHMIRQKLGEAYQKGWLNTNGTLNGRSIAPVMDKNLEFVVFTVLEAISEENAHFILDYNISQRWRFGK